jgi:hypothetical protein
MRSRAIRKPVSLADLHHDGTRNTAESCVPQSLRPAAPNRAQHGRHSDHDARALGQQPFAQRRARAQDGSWAADQHSSLHTMHVIERLRAVVQVFDPVATTRIQYTVLRSALTLKNANQISSRAMSNEKLPA